MYELTLQNFTGPIEKLLELIEEKKLQINEISLAEVTDDFLRYFYARTDAEIARTRAEKSLRESTLSPFDSAVNMQLLADFVVVASRLIFIKSRSLLPDLELTPDEEAGIKDLERRLMAYRTLKPAMKIVARLWAGEEKEFSRPYFLNIAGAAGVFYPGKNLDLAALANSLERIFEILGQTAIEKRTIKEKIISLEEKIKEVIGRLKEIGPTTLGNLSNEKSKSEIIVIFLALLHLAREQQIFLEQESHFSDIMVMSSRS